MYKYLASAIISGSSTTSVTFSSIPQTHKTLVLFTTVRDNRATVTTSSLYFRINSLGNNNNYQSYMRSIDGTLSAVYNTPPVDTSGFLAAANGSQNANPGVGIFYFYDYTKATHRKAWNYGGVGPYNTVTGGIGQLGTWTNTTDAMTSLIVQSATGTNFIADSSFYLYGIS